MHRYVICDGGIYYLLIDWICSIKKNCNQHQRKYSFFHDCFLYVFNFFVQSYEKLSSFLFYLSSFFYTFAKINFALAMKRFFLSLLTALLAVGAWADGQQVVKEVRLLNQQTLEVVYADSKLSMLMGGR